MPTLPGGARLCCHAAVRASTFWDRKPLAMLHALGPTAFTFPQDIAFFRVDRVQLFFLPVSDDLLGNSHGLKSQNQQLADEVF